MKFQFPFVTLLVGVAAQSAIITELNERISPQVTKLANDVEEFPGSGLDGALTIDSDSKDLGTIFDTATQNARSIGSFSLVDGTVILADLAPVVLTLTGTLRDLSAKKDDFNRLVLPAAALVLSDLQKLNQSAIEYANALVEDAPLLEVVTFIAIRDTLAGAFAATIDDYTP